MGVHWCWLLPAVPSFARPTGTARHGACFLIDSLFTYDLVDGLDDQYLRRYLLGIAVQAEPQQGGTGDRSSPFPRCHLTGTPSMCLRLVVHVPQALSTNQVRADVLP